MSLNLSEKLKTGLTPQEKIDCYEYAIKRIKVADAGICYELTYCFFEWELMTSEKIYKLFPEFAKLKPINKGDDDFWYDSTKERIEALNKLIEEQKKLL